MNMLKFGYGIVLDCLSEFPEFHFFSGVWTLQDPINSLNVWKDIFLESKHVGAHLMDQLKKKCVI